LGFVNFNFTPNVLDQYANYTYHIRWSMTSDQTTKYAHTYGTSKFYNSVQKIIIAESGGTVLYNITDFEMENLVPGSPTSTSTQSLKFEMTIVEPYGITLVDSIYSASLGLGISNYNTSAGYFIEIWFTGYNEDGSIATPSLNANLYKLWQVQIQQIQSTTTESGTTYKISFLPVDQYAWADHVGIVSNAVTIGPVQSVGDFFSLLKNELTKQNANLYQDKTPRIRYQINTPDWMDSWKFDKSLTTSQRNSSLEIKSSGTNTTVSISRGMDVVTILHMVISMTKEGQQFVAGEPTNSGANNTTTGGASLKNNSLANIISIHGWLDQLDFDPLTNDYIRQATYTFLKYPTGRPIIDQKNAANGRQPAQQNSRRQYYATSKRFVKEYFWTYTGKNLDVLRFELKLNWVGQTGILNNLGYNTYSNFTVGQQYNQSGISNQLLQKYITAKANQQSAQQALNNASNNSGAMIDDITTQISQAQNKLDQANEELSSIQQSNPNVNFEQIATNQTLSGQAMISASKEANNSQQKSSTTYGVINANNQQANSALNLPGTSITDQRLNIYLEDVALSSLSSSPIPLSFRANQTPIVQNTNLGGDGPQENSSNSNSASNLPPSRSLVSSILNEMGQDGLRNIELEIRGDPYWLGLGNIDLQNSIGDGNSVTPPDINAARIFQGDTGFSFTLKTGQSYDENTGIMKLDDKIVMFNGYYIVNKIRSTFKQGQFTSVIVARRDDILNPALSNQSSSTAASQNNTQASSQTPQSAAQPVEINPAGISY